VLRAAPQEDDQWREDRNDRERQPAEPPLPLASSRTVSLRGPIRWCEPPAHLVQ
jgi:hypothetical protein